MDCTFLYKWPQTIPTVYARSGYDNRSKIVLYRTISPRKQRANLTPVTRMCLSFTINNPPVVLDSNLYPNIIDWETDGDEGYVYLSLGRWQYPSTFDACSQFAFLIVYVPTYSNGILWGALRVVW